MQRTRIRAKAGFTLVELMVVVAIVGILASISTYAMRRYLAASKSSEARANLGGIGRGVQLAYEGASEGPQLLLPGETSTTTRSLCGSTSKVPATVPKGRKYMVSAVEGKDFETGSSTAGWRCIRFALSGTIFYRYAYIKGASGLVASKNPAKPPTTGFEVSAQGDLDGDGVLSTLAWTGDAPDPYTLRMSTAIYLENETE